MCGIAGPDPNPKPDAGGISGLPNEWKSVATPP